MMATSGHMIEGEISTCSICLERLRSPRSLPCLHTFCFQCISEYILSTGRRAGHKITNYTCPVCRTIVTPPNVETDIKLWIESLPSNFASSPFMETQNHKDCHICKRKKKNINATKWCRDCTEAYCDDCCDTHSFIESSTNHKVVDIGNIQTNEYGIDLCKTSDACSVHTSKVIEAYCFDHQQLCCVLCVTLHHRKCKDVQAIEDIIKINDDKSSFEANWTEILSDTEKILKEQRDEETILKKSLSSIESTAVESVNSAKNKLDSLLITFLKELKLNEEKLQHDVEEKLNIFVKLISRIGELLRKTTFIRSYGSKTHLFIHLQRSKTELISEIEKSVQSLCGINDVKATFDIENVLYRLTEIAHLGNVHFTEKRREYVAEYIHILTDRSYLHSSAVFPCLHLIKRKTIHLSGYDLKVGMCISDQTIVLGSKARLTSSYPSTESFLLSIVDASTGKVTKECTLSAEPRGLTYDTEHKTFYISCSVPSEYTNHSHLYSVKFDKDKGFEKPREIIKKNDSRFYSGGVCIHDNCLYLNVGTEIRKMNLNQGGELQTAFLTDRDGNNRNRLAIDCKNRRLIRMTYDNVICTSLDGKEIYSHKERELNSVSLNTRGIIFAGDRQWSVHLISDDWKQRRTLLEKCEKIINLRDIWLDKSEKTLFVCGNEYVELYDVTY